MTSITQHQTFKKMTNNIFQFNRFGTLIARHTSLKTKIWLQSMIIFAGLPVFFLLLNASNIGVNIDQSDRASLLEFIVYFTFIFAPFAHFYSNNHPKKGLTEVMLPASVLEKYVSMQFVCIVIAPLAALLPYGAADSLLALIFPNIYGGYALTEAFASDLKFEPLMILLLFQQIIFFCNLIFIRRKVIKTGGVFVISLIVLVTLLAAIGTIWGNRIENIEGDNYSYNFNDRALFEIYPNDHPALVALQIFRILVVIVAPVALMIGSYFVMKNKRY